MQEVIYQCAVCGARVLRSRPIDAGDACPRCGRRGQMEPFGQERRPEPVWLRKLIAEIEGGSGPVRWN